MKRTSKLLIAIAAVTGLLALPAGAQVELKTLLIFTGPATGAFPVSSLTFDAAGNLYGTTGETDDFSESKVFQLSPNSDGTWTENVLWASTGGETPNDIRGGVVFDTAGNLYGTSRIGGVGCGTAFELASNSDGSWSEINLVNFNCGVSGAGSVPVDGLIIDTAGNLFGTTLWGGDYYAGKIFELTPNSDGTWTEKTLHSFTGGKDGGYPDRPSLALDSSGTLYGVATGGGDPACTSGCGVVFKLAQTTSAAWKFTTLHRFSGGTDGGVPESRLIFDQSGNLYGTTSQGGTYGYGVAFKLAPAAGGKWTERVLHRFRGGADGASPFGGLIFDIAGNLYGTTLYGGNGGCGLSIPGCGTVYKLTPTPDGGTREEVLVRFNGAPNGAPYGHLAMDGMGNLYGTTSGQTTKRFRGTVYEVTLGSH